MKKDYILILIAVLILIGFSINTHEQENYEYPSWLINHKGGEKIIDIIEKDRQEVVSAQEEYETEFKEEPTAPYTFSVDFEYTDKYNTKNNSYSSILVVENEYTGGAHSNYKFYSFTYKDDEEITLEEFLQSSNIKEGYILNNLQSQLEKEDDLFEDSKIETLEDIPIWFLGKEKTIELIFPPYYIAPFSSGIKRYSIDISQF